MYLKQMCPLPHSFSTVKKIIPQCSGFFIICDEKSNITLAGRQLSYVPLFHVCAVSSYRGCFQDLFIFGFQQFDNSVRRYDFLVFILLELVQILESSNLYLLPNLENFGYFKNHLYLLEYLGRLQS